MRAVDARVRWAIVAVGLVAAVAVALVVANRPRAVEHGPHTWVVQPGETQTFSADDVHPGDEYICPGKDRLIGTPDPGHAVGSGELAVATNADGSVVATCG
jgi:hypothetical protein